MSFIAVFLAEHLGKRVGASLAALMPVLLIVAAAAMLFLGGNASGRAEAKAGYDAAIAAKELGNERALSQQRADALADLEAAVALGERLQAEIDALSERREQAVRTIVKRIPHVTTVYLPAPGAEPVALPACPFTVGYQRLWNAALTLDRLRPDPDAPAAGMDAAAEPAADSAAAGADHTAGADPGSAADSALQIAAGLTPAAILENHTLNAERCAGIEVSRRALLAWHREQKVAAAP